MYYQHRDKISPRHRSFLKPQLGAHTNFGLRALEIMKGFHEQVVLLGTVVGHGGGALLESLTNLAADLESALHSAKNM